MVKYVVGRVQLGEIPHHPNLFSNAIIAYTKTKFKSKSEPHKTKNGKILTAFNPLLGNSNPSGHIPLFHVQTAM